MRSVEVVIVGVLLMFVATVPSGWQDRRFSRFLPGGNRLVADRRSRGLGERMVKALCLVSGIAFVVLGVLDMFR